MTPTNRSSQVGRNIRAELARAGRTQVQAAEALHMSAMSLSRRLRGDVALGVDELYALADFLEISVSELLVSHSPAQNVSLSTHAASTVRDRKAAS